MSAFITGKVRAAYKRVQKVHIKTVLYIAQLKSFGESFVIPKMIHHKFFKGF